MLAGIDLLSASFVLLLNSAQATSRSSCLWAIKEAQSRQARGSAMLEQALEGARMTVDWLDRVALAAGRPVSRRGLLKLTASLSLAPSLLAALGRPRTPARAPPTPEIASNVP